MLRSPYVHTLGRSKERGRKRVPRDGPPTCSLQPSILLCKTNVPNLSYQNDGLCDWGTASCAADGHLQTHVALFVKLSRAGSMLRCGVRGLVGTVQIGAWSVCFAVSTIPKITILPTHTLVKTVARRIRRKREWCRQCNLFPRAAHLPAVKQQGSRPATDEHELEHEDSRPPQLYTSLQPWTTNGESKITCLVCQSISARPLFAGPFLSCYCSITE
jgi:hypothetical protein